MRQQQWAYDELGRLLRAVGAGGQTRSFAYDLNDNPVGETNPRQFAHSQAFDALDRLVGQSDPLGGKTQLAYDAQDNLTEVKDPRGVTTRYEYDGLGNLTRLVSPDSGTTTFEHDAAGNVIRRTDARGFSTCWIRVAQNWAGADWGHMAIPRIGQEVIVDYLDGDCDQPIVTGRTYRATNRPPYALPDHKILSTIKSKEYKGSRANELRIDDTTAQISAALMSDHGASALHLGYLTHPRPEGGKPRGEGFELRTDEHGAVRAAKGLLLSTEEQLRAGAGHLDRGVVVQVLEANSSPGASVTVDSQAPAAPVLNPSNGTTLSGTAEPGATVSLTDGNGNPIGQVTADGSGNWSFTPGTPLANGTVVNATASDPTGNTSAPASTTVDSVAPAAPVVNPSNGAEISGTAEPGATVTLTDGSGNPIGQVTADGSGNWSFTPSTPLADGTVVNATATDPAGNTGGQGSTTVDAIAPATPTVNLSNGSSLSGTAEPGRDRLVRVHRRRLVDAEIRLIQRDPLFLGLLEVAAPLRVVDAELVLMPEDAFLPTIGPNEVDVLADQLADGRTQQAGVLGDQVDVQALVPVRFEARDLLRARPGAIVTEHPLRFIDHDHRAIRQVVPLLRRIELDPLRLEPIQLHIRDAVVVDRPGRQVRIVRVLVQPLGRVVRVRLVFNVDFPNRVQGLASAWQAGAQIEHIV